MELSDQALITKYKDTKDPQHVAQLHSRYRHLVFAASMKYLNHREEAEDAASDIYEELVVKLLVHEVSNFKSWLYSLTRNHCLMKLRKTKGISEVNIQNEKIENSFMENPSFEHLIDEAASETELLRSALNQLKDHQRLCVELFFFQDLSYKEISDRTGFDMSQVKSYIQNGKRNLQLILSKTT